MKQYLKIIFVDSSDTTRSPMAEVVLKSMKMDYPISIHSRGLVVLFPEPMNQKAEAILISNGYGSQKHMSKPLTQDDIGDGIRCAASDDGRQSERKGVSGIQ